MGKLDKKAIPVQPSNICSDQVFTNGKKHAKSTQTQPKPVPPKNTWNLKSQWLCSDMVFYIKVRRSVKGGQYEDPAAQQHPLPKSCSSHTIDWCHCDSILSSIPLIFVPPSTFFHKLPKRLPHFLWGSALRKLNVLTVLALSGSSWSLQYPFFSSGSFGTDPPHPSPSAFLSNSVLFCPLWPKMQGERVAGCLVLGTKIIWY